jgi:hypothetical protein
MATGDLEGHDHATAAREIRDGAAHLHDAHRLVTEDVAFGHERGEYLVQVQVRAADGGRGDADDRIVRVLHLRVGDSC